MLAGKFVLHESGWCPRHYGAQRPIPPTIALCLIQPQTHGAAFRPHPTAARRAAANRTTLGDSRCSANGTNALLAHAFKRGIYRGATKRSPNGTADGCVAATLIRLLPVAVIRPVGTGRPIRMPQSPPRRRHRALCARIEQERPRWQEVARLPRKRLRATLCVCSRTSPTPRFRLGGRCIEYRLPVKQDLHAISSERRG